MKLAVLMWYDENISSYGDNNYKINKAYCDKYNIEIIKCSEQRHSSRHTAWEKIPLILKHINNYDYVIWIDADAHFYINSQNILNLINENKNYNIMFSQDTESPINTGVYIVKNTPYSIEFLTKWGYDNELYKNNKYPYWWDQGVLIDMYKDDVLDIKNNSIIINYGILQHFYPSEIKKFKNKPFIFHLAGRNKEIREIHSSNYMKHIGL
jgi:hypothetical protein